MSRDLQETIKPEAYRAILVCPSRSHPRFHRRVRALQSAGVKISVYTFERGYFSDNDFPGDVEVTPLGSIQNKQYLRRLPKLLKAIQTLRKAEQPVSDYVFVYSFGLDCLLIGALALRGCKIIFEVGDIRTGSRSKMSHLLRFAESRLLRLVDVLVVTSPHYWSKYYSKLTEGISTTHLVIENKMQRDDVPQKVLAVNPLRAARIRVGVIGSLRYESVLNVALAIAEIYSDTFEVHVYGDGPLLSMVVNSKHSNVFYHGPFKYPDDLEKIYGSIDINCVVYDSTDFNVTVALPNKLYESILFRVPIIAASRTQLGDYVTSRDIGMTVDSDGDVSDAAQLVWRNRGRIGAWRDACADIPEDDVVEQPIEVGREIVEVVSNVG